MVWGQKYRWNILVGLVWRFAYTTARHCNRFPNVAECCWCCRWCYCFLSPPLFQMPSSILFGVNGSLLIYAPSLSTLNTIGPSHPFLHLGLLRSSYCLSSTPWSFGSDFHPPINRNGLPFLYPEDCCRPFHLSTIYHHRLRFSFLSVFKTIVFLSSIFSTSSWCFSNAPGTALSRIIYSQAGQDHMKINAPVLGLHARSSFFTESFCCLSWVLISLPSFLTRNRFYWQ